MNCRFVMTIILMALLLSTGIEAADKPNNDQTQKEQTLLAGWATADITPPKPIALIGQLHKRISTGVLDPLTATVLAIEADDDSGHAEQAIMVSCDLLFIRQSVQQRLQERIRTQVTDFDCTKLFLNATHTHDGPGFLDSTFKGLYDVSNDPGVMKPSEYADFFLDRVAQAVVEAWQNRKPATVSWAIGFAMVGRNRRVHYFDGTTVMYGATNSPNFANIEGYQDNAVKLLAFWNPEHRLTGLIINLACPSQETENLTEISADFWHDVRRELRKRHGPDLFVFPQCSAAGDQSPHPTYRTQAEQVMDKRRGLSRRQEIARRIANAVEDVLPLAKAEMQKRPIFRHSVVKLDLPEHQPPVLPFYETDSVHPMELHVLRLGDVAMATNPFELYLDYGIRIEARSSAVLTMLVQLSGAACGYLPSEKGVQGGGYSADKFLVGPAGGQVLVDETVQRINQLWP